MILTQNLVRTSLYVRIRSPGPAIEPMQTKALIVKINAIINLTSEPMSESKCNKRGKEKQYVRLAQFFCKDIRFKIPMFEIQHSISHKSCSYFAFILHDCVALI